MSDKMKPEEILIIDEKRVEQKVIEEDAQEVVAGAANGYGKDAFVAAAHAQVLVKDTVTQEETIEEVILPAPRRRKKRWLLLPLLLALLLALLLVGTAFASSTATITVVLDQHTIAGTVAISQQAHAISTTGKLAQTIPAGIVYVPGQHAHGLLTFHSANIGCGCAVVVPAGTVFHGADGIAVITESAAILGPSCTVSVPAQALVSGPVGDIRAFDIQTLYSKGISVQNGAAFSDGTNGYYYSVVQQSSINSITHKFAARLSHTVPLALDAKANQAGLTLLSKHCIAYTSANHKAGQTAKNVTVVITMTCTAQAYNPRAAEAQALQLLTQQAQAAFGNDYTLTDLAQDKVTTAILVDPRTGTVLVTAMVQGRWTYQLQKEQRQEITHMLAGKDLDDAIVFLHEQRGIESASIARSSYVPNMLPVIANNINIVVNK